jgi:hypothetical protein
VKEQKNEILTRQESRHSSRPDVFYFLPSAHFLKQLPTHIAHIAKARQANAETKALPKSAIYLHSLKQDICRYNELSKKTSNLCLIKVPP